MLKTLQNAFKAVSYTHLDVYKRQHVWVPVKVLWNTG